MTLGQQAVQQASQKAHHQGMRETACRMLKENMEIQLVVKFTQLPMEEIIDLAKKIHH